MVYSRRRAGVRRDQIPRPAEVLAPVCARSPASFKTLRRIYTIENRFLVHLEGALRHRLEGSAEAAVSRAKIGEVVRRRRGDPQSGPRQLYELLTGVSGDGTLRCEATQRQLGPNGQQHDVQCIIMASVRAASMRDADPAFKEQELKAYTLLEYDHNKCSQCRLFSSAEP